MTDWQQVLAGLAATLAALGVVWKVVLPGIKMSRRWARSVGRMRDVLLGTPEVVDPDRPGELIQEAVPDLGVRVTRVEDLVSRNIVAMMEATKENAAAAKESAAASAESASASSLSARAAGESAETSRLLLIEQDRTSRLTLIEQDRRIGNLECAYSDLTGKPVPGHHGVENETPGGDGNEETA